MAMAAPGRRCSPALDRRRSAWVVLSDLTMRRMDGRTPLTWTARVFDTSMPSIVFLTGLKPCGRTDVTEQVLTEPYKMDELLGVFQGRFRSHLAETTSGDRFMPVPSPLPSARPERQLNEKMQPFPGSAPGALRRPHEYSAGSRTTRALIPTGRCSVVRRTGTNPPGRLAGGRIRLRLDPTRRAALRLIELEEPTGRLKGWEA